jgi:hypothetical protein
VTIADAVRVVGSRRDAQIRHHENAEDAERILSASSASLRETLLLEVRPP